MLSDPQLGELLGRWQELRRQGQSPALEQLCADCPELREVLGVQIAALLRREANQKPNPNEGTSANTLPEDAALAPGQPAGDAAAAQTPGSIIAGYEILGELGRGGMGVVYKARQTSLNRIVALKMILAGGHAGAADLARFRTEAEAVARLQHPGIVQIHEVGEHAGLPFFSLEFCAGGSLDKKLDGTPLPPRTSAPMVEDLARAVQAAHEQGIVHRDLKPANILLAVDSGPWTVDPAPGDAPRTTHHAPRGFKITDFGLAKRLDTAAGQTQSGAVLGTPSYMAPEQARGQGRDVGPAADIYALGAILYELLTGRPPFKAATSWETVLQVLAVEPVPPSQLQPKTPRDLATICLKCLQKTAGRRYATAAALADDLRRFQAGEPIAARPVSWLEKTGKWVRRRPAVAALLALVLLVTTVGLGLVGWQWWEAEQARQLADEQRNRAEEQKDRADREATNARERQWTLEQTLEKLKTETQARETATRAQAEAERTRAAALAKVALESRTALYARDLAEVRRAWQNLNLARAESLLNNCPFDLRGWEWNYLQDCCRRTCLTLRGHSKWVNGLAFSPDGKRVATAGEDQTVRLWDTATGEELYVIKAHVPSPPTADPALGMPLTGAHTVAYSPDGRWMATGGEDKLVQIWEAATGRLVRTCKGHSNRVMTVAFSPDGQRLASAGDDKVIKLWDPLTGQELKTLAGHTAPIYTIAFSPDGTKLASGGEDKQARFWDLATAKILRTLPSRSLAVLSVAFSPDGQRLAVASGSADRNGTVSFALGLVPTNLGIWDLTTGREVVPLSYANGYSAVVFSPDGLRLMSGKQAGEIQVWDAIQGRELQHLSGPGGNACLALSPDGQRLASAGVTGNANLWNLTAQAEAITLNNLEGLTLTTAAVSPDGKLIASASWNGKAKVLQWLDGKKPGDYEVWDLAHGGVINAVAFSPNSKLLATAGDNHQVKVWDLASGRCVRILNGHRDRVQGVAWDRDGKRLASCGNDGTIRLWNADTGKQVLLLHGHTAGATCVAFSPDGQRLASGGADRTVCLWEAASGKELRRWQGFADPVAAVAFSPDGRSLAASAGRPDGLRSDEARTPVVRIWDTAEGRETLAITNASNPVWSVAFSPNGKFLAGGTCIWDEEAQRAGAGAVRIWDVVTGEEVGTLRHDDRVTSVAYDPSGAFLVSQGKDQQLRVWRVANGEMLGKMDPEKCPVEMAALSPDDRHVAAAAGEHLRIWEASTGKLLTDLKPHGAKVSHVVYSPDGGLLASTGPAARPQPPQERGDSEVKIWDASGKLLHTLHGHSHETTCLAFSPDGRHLATGGGRLDPEKKKRGFIAGEVIIWNTTDGRELLRFSGHSLQIKALAFSPSGRSLVTGGDTTIRIWDAATGQETGLWKGTGWVTSLVFNAEETLVASCGENDFVVRVWEFPSGQQKFALDGRRGRVKSVAFSRDGKRLVSASLGDTSGTGRSQSGEMTFWDLATGQEVFSLPGHAGVVTSVAFSREGERLLSASLDQTIKLWDAPSAAEMTAFRARVIGVSRLALHPNGTSLACGGQNGMIRVWNFTLASEVQSYTGHKGPVMTVVFSPDGTRLASATGAYNRNQKVPLEVKIWDTATGKEVLALQPPSPVFGLAFSPDGERLAVVGRAGTIQIWNAQSGQLVLELPQDQRRPNVVTRVAFTPDGRQFITAGASKAAPDQPWSDGLIQIWDAATGKEIRSIAAHADYIHDLAVSADGRWVASASYDGLVRVWDRETGVKLSEFDRHQNKVKAVTFTPDGRYVASAGDDATVRIWDAQTARQLCMFKGHPVPIMSVAFSADGKTLVSAAFDGTVRVWNWERAVHELNAQAELK